jgi:hypothetical protein
MSNLARFVAVAAIAALAAASAAAQTAVPDFRGTWKGESHSIVSGGAHPHHPGAQANEPRFDSTAFTLTVDKQDGRRFFGTFSSARGNDPVIAVMSRNGTIYAVDDDGYTLGTMLAPNRMEWCYMHLSSTVRVASCTELTKQ